MSKGPAMQLLEQQRVIIEQSRRADFDRLLLEAFTTSTDTTAVKMRSALTDPTEEQLLIEAGKWYDMTK